MINRLHARLHRPENGWDPVPAAHASTSGAGEWSWIDQALLDDLDQRIGGFKGKSVLDLGGGPGQYTAAMAKRGARVTWHDVSRIYLDMSRSRVEGLGLADQVTFSLGYLDEAPHLLPERFDLVFNRICWNYGFGDRSFAKVVYALVRPGGFGYVDTTHSSYQREQLSTTARLRTWLNDCTAIKIGHPYPPRGRLARLFLRHEIERLSVDYRTPTNDRICSRGQRPVHDGALPRPLRRHLPDDELARLGATGAGAAGPRGQADHGGGSRQPRPASGGRRAAARFLGKGSPLAGPGLDHRAAWPPAFVCHARSRPGRHQPLQRIRQARRRSAARKAAACAGRLRARRRARRCLGGAGPFLRCRDAAFAAAGRHSRGERRFYTRPVRHLGAVWVPQQLWRFRPMRKGLWTVCFHHNNLDPAAVDRFARDVAAYAQCIVDMPTAIGLDAVAPRGRLDAAFASAWMAALRLKRIGAAG